MTNCVVLSTQRSGSTFLIDFLSSTPGILVHSELFQNLRPDLVGRPNAPRHYALAYQTYRKASFPRRLAHRFRRPALIGQYLEEIYAPKPEIDVIGMKLMYNQTRKYPEVLDWLIAHDVFFIHLVRENLLDMVVSRELAIKRGTYSMLQPLDNLQVQLDVSTLTSELESIADEVAHFRALCASLRAHELTYEAMVADKSGSAREILQRLDARGREPAGSRLRKTNPALLKSVIANYAEVAAVLERHPHFSRFLT
jgi:LPS sulfotransferase NodH